MLLKFVLTLALLDVICVFGGFLPRTFDNGNVDPNAYPALGQRSHVPSRESRQTTDDFLKNLPCELCLYIVGNTPKELAGNVTAVIAIASEFCKALVGCSKVIPQVAQAISKAVANGTELDDVCDGPELCAVQKRDLTNMLSNPGDVHVPN